MPRMTMSLSGLSELSAQFRNLRREVRGPVLKAAVMEAGQFCQRDAQRRIRDQGAIDTGNYVGSIITEPVEITETTASADMGSGPGSITGTDVEYAPMIEFGTSKMAARPAIRPALEENADKVDKIFARHLKKAIERGAR